MPTGHHDGLHSEYMHIERTSSPSDAKSPQREIDDVVVRINSTDSSDRCAWSSFSKDSPPQSGHSRPTATGRKRTVRVAGASHQHQRRSLPGS
jgi:hypothetical protein